MAHDMTADMLAQTKASALRPVIFVEVDAQGGNVYLWSGYGNILWNSITWIGAGNFLGIGAVTEQNKVMAPGTALTLSGVSQANISLVLTDLRRYLPARAWIGAMDDSFNLVASPYQFLNGRVDTASIISDEKTCTISIMAESRIITMRNPKWRRYTDLDQRIEHTADAGFSFVDTIQDASIDFHG